MAGLFGAESVLLLVIAVELGLIYIRLGQKKP
jgi:hypothetical protein